MLDGDGVRAAFSRAQDRVLAVTADERHRIVEDPEDAARLLFYGFDLPSPEMTAMAAAMAQAGLLRMVEGFDVLEVLHGFALQAVLVGLELGRERDAAGG